jgi:hypothetical protein
MPAARLLEMVETGSTCLGIVNVGGVAIFARSCYFDGVKLVTMMIKMHTNSR